MSHPYSLVIFDWDGTLVDSIEQIVTALRGAIVDLGLPVREDEQLRDIIGLGLEEALAKLFPELPLEEVIAVAKRYRHHYFLGENQPLQPFHGIPDLLKDLTGAGNTLAVATGKSRRGLDVALAQTGLGPLFKATRCADESDSKPAPTMVIELLERLWMEPSEAIVIGDTEYDLEMAANAGVASIGVTWGVHPQAHLEKFGPVAVVDDVATLRSALLG